MNRYTKYSDDELFTHLGKIRRIAKMDDVDAILELDEFLYRLTPNRSAIESANRNDVKFLEDYEIESAENELHAFLNQLNKISLQYQDRVITNMNIYDIYSIRNNADNLGLYWKKKVMVQYKEQLQSYKNQGYKFVEEMEIKYHTGLLENDDMSCLHIVTSVPSVLHKTLEAEKFLSAKNILTDELSNRAKEIRLKCAWFRARKKLTEAEIAKGGKNLTKYNKMIGEAEVVLKQDWENIMPNDPLPLTIV